jgi:hypothetical protein
MYAINSMRPRAVQLLIDAGVDVNDPGVSSAHCRMNPPYQLMH